MSEYEENDYKLRQLASIEDKPNWERVREYSVTATDVSLLSSETSIPSILSKKYEGSFFGNKYTYYGNQREPEILDWAGKNYGMEPNVMVFHAGDDQRRLATPDGIMSSSEGLVLAEIKTTNKPFKSVPVKYLRQVYWQQYVLGAERTMFIWEQHEDFVPLPEGPQIVWVERDEEKIKKLVSLSQVLLERIDEIKEQRSHLNAAPPAIQSYESQSPLPLWDDEPAPW